MEEESFIGTKPVDVEVRRVSTDTKRSDVRTEMVSAGDILSRPFNFVSGNQRKRSVRDFFRKKSGLMNVIAKQSARNRIVFKNGHLNTVGSTEGKSFRFLKDFFVTILDLSWTWIFLMFAAAFFLSWLGFAGIWHLTFIQHGDFDEENKNDPDFVPCVAAIEDFTSSFLFSIETQHTIGYGGR